VSVFAFVCLCLRVRVCVCVSVFACPYSAFAFRICILYCAPGPRLKGREPRGRDGLVRIYLILRRLQYAALGLRSAPHLHPVFLCFAS